MEDLYNEVMRGCVRHLGITDPGVIGQMTIREYNTMMSAAAYRDVDSDYRDRVLAWNINQAGAMKSGHGGRAEPVFRTFKDFYDYDQAIKDLEQQQKTGGDTKEDTLTSRMADYYRKHRKE